MLKNKTGIRNQTKNNNKPTNNKKKGGKVMSEHAHKEKHTSTHIKVFVVSL